MNSFYSRDELENLGFQSVGRDVLISRKCSIYGIENISVGDHCRIDDFVILSGRIQIGRYVHIAAGTYLYGGEAGIFMDDFSGIASHGSVYTVTDIFFGGSMINPTVPEEYRMVKHGKVIIGKHVSIGASSVVLPSVCLGEGSAFGAMSLINRNARPWTMYAGRPIKKLIERERKPQEMEEQMMIKELKESEKDCD